MGGWETLPINLLRMIVDKVSFYDDKVRMACVCKSWKPVFPNMSKKCLLLVPYRHDVNDDDDDDDDDDDVDVDVDDVFAYNVDVDAHAHAHVNVNVDRRASHKLVDVVEKRTCCLLDLHGHVKQGRIYVGSSYGWLISVEVLPSISLINPFTKFEIQLPPRFTFPDVLEYQHVAEVDPIFILNGNDYLIKDEGLNGNVSNFTESSFFVRDVMTLKIILSSDPSSTKDYMAVAIYGNHRRLAYCRRGDDKWYEIKGVADVADIIFYKGELHALTFSYELMNIVDIDACTPRVTEKTREVNKFTGVPHHEMAGCRRGRYLVECCGELLMVIPYGGIDPTLSSELYFTDGFVVYKFEVIHRQWKLVTDIGDNALFVGLNTSLSLHVSQLFGVTRNAVYFSDDHLWVRENGDFGGYNNGIFDLGEKLILPVWGYNKPTVRVIPPPIWILRHC